MRDLVPRGVWCLCYNLNEGLEFNPGLKESPTPISVDFRHNQDRCQIVLLSFLAMFEKTSRLICNAIN